LIETRAGVSKSNCSEGRMRTYKVTQGTHYDADARITVRETEPH